MRSILAVELGKHVWTSELGIQLTLLEINIKHRNKAERYIAVSSLSKSFW